MTEWKSKVHSTDNFSDPIIDEFIDGRTNGGTSWAIFTPRSWRSWGCGRLGPGHGQRYRKNAEGKWMKVEG